MPWTATEAVSNEKGSDRDRDGECDKGSNRTNGEDGTDGDVTCEDEEDAAASDEDIEPDGIDGRFGGLIDTGPITG